MFNLYKVEKELQKQEQGMKKYEKESSPRVIMRKIRK